MDYPRLKSTFVFKQTKDLLKTQSFLKQSKKIIIMSTEIDDYISNVKIPTLNPAIYIKWIDSFQENINRTLQLYQEALAYVQLCEQLAILAKQKPYALKLLRKMEKHSRIIEWIIFPICNKLLHEEKYTLEKKFQYVIQQYESFIKK